MNDADDLSCRGGIGDDGIKRRRQAELLRCRALRETVAPLLQAGEGISAVGRSNRSVRRCIWIQRIAVRKKIHGAETW